MKLCRESIKDKEKWESAGFKLPAFDIESVCDFTSKNPLWLHFGPGNIFRIFPAAVQQQLLNNGDSNAGIIVCKAFDEETIDKIFIRCDNLTAAVTLKPEGIEKEVIASVTECIKASTGMGRLYEIFRSPSLQLVSFTITEKSYAVTDASGNILPHIKEDMENGPESAKSHMGLAARLCLVRFLAGKLPLALVSMDNCAENGEKLKQAITSIAEAWVEKGHAPKEFPDYLNDGKTVAFPCTMIDKITPRPSELIAEQLKSLGIEGMEVLKTSRNTYSAPFVNAEPTQYLVIEDTFPNGRPPLEKAGVIFTDRETVGKVEKMKVGACLNPLHSILAVFGCLLGYEFIYEEMKNPALVNLIKTAGYNEALPYVEDPVIIKPEDFIKAVIDERLPNPYIPDTPQRIAMDTSQKIPVRFGETLKKMASLGAGASVLVAFPFFFAGWLRYLLGVDDAGEPFEISSDPMLQELRAALSDVKLGDKGQFAEVLKPILSNSAIFGVSLYENGLASKTAEYFSLMASGPGAVANTLEYCFNRK